MSRPFGLFQQTIVQSLVVPPAHAYRSFISINADSHPVAFSTSSANKIRRRWYRRGMIRAERRYCSSTGSQIYGIPVTRTRVMEPLAVPLACVSSRLACREQSERERKMRRLIIMPANVAMRRGAATEFSFEIPLAEGFFEHRRGIRLLIAILHDDGRVQRNVVLCRKIAGRRPRTRDENRPGRYG